MVDDNFLYSFCFNLEKKNINNRLDILERTSDTIKTKYKFYEIIIILSEETYKLILNRGKRKKISNIRYIVLKKYVNYYKKRSICAHEAIGDIVFISSFDEIEVFNIIDMISYSISNDKIVVGLKQNSTFLYKVLFLILKLIGYLAKIDINQNISGTIAIPRAELNRILEDEYVDLKLRFPPSDSYFTSSTNKTTNYNDLKHHNFKDRISIIYMSLLNITPILLRALTFFSGITILTSIFYFIYIIIIWIFKNQIQPGWITVSLSVTGVSFFLSSSSFILSIGLQHIINKIKNKKSDNHYEIKEIDIFEKTKHDLNVDIS